MTKPKRSRSPVLAGVLSAILPGAGQIYAGQIYRGAAILFGFLVTLGMVAYFGQVFWYIAPILIWAWNILDAVLLAQGRKPRLIFIPVLAGLAAAYSIGWQVVQIDFASADLNRAVQIARPMLHPDFIQPRRESIRNVGGDPGTLPPEHLPPVGTRSGIWSPWSPRPAPVCASLSSSRLSGMWPDTDTQIWWEDPSGQDKMISPGEDSMLVVRTDASGSLTTSFPVPTSALIAVPDVTVSPPHRIYFRQYRPLGGIELSFVGSQVVKGARDTIAMALIATLLAIIFAIPLSFLAAHNLMAVIRLPVSSIM